MCGIAAFLPLYGKEFVRNYFVIFRWTSLRSAEFAAAPEQKKSHCSTHANALAL